MGVGPDGVRTRSLGNDTVDGWANVAAVEESGDAIYIVFRPQGMRTMPRTFVLDGLPAGYSLTAALPGENCVVQATGFYSSEDGNDFVSRLDEVGDFFDAAFRSFGVRPSMVDHLLAVVNKDRQATVYCNELRILCSARRRMVHAVGVPAGTVLIEDDIAGVDELDLLDAENKPVEIPAECGVAFIFSYRWRKAIFFDFSVLGGHQGPREAHLPRLFGRYFTQLMFQQMYSASEEQWRRLFGWGWFPFMGLSHEERKSLLALAKSDRYLAPMLEDLCRSFCRELAGRLGRWGCHELLSKQMPWLSLAAEHYRKSEYPSCIAVLYPRIEGVMRTLYAQENADTDPSSPQMVENLVENQPPYSALLPGRFKEYLRQVFFGRFDLSRGEVSLSRNSHAHGVSCIGEYDLIRASVGFMIVDQIAYYLTD